MVGVPAYHTLPQAKGHRFIKTHLPVSLLPFNILDSGAKLVYVARHPKDVAVSNFYLAKLLKFINNDVPFENYYDKFEKNLSKFAFHILK